MKYRVAALSEAVSNQVRETMKSPRYGHAAQLDKASAAGYGPCRSCLKTFREGEERILFTHEPFEEKNAVPLPGPVFVHREPCAAHDGDGFPSEIRRLPLLFEGHAEDGFTVARERIVGEDVEGAISRLFGLSAVEFIHVRNFEAGCFIARIERDGSPRER